MGPEQVVVKDEENLQEGENLFQLDERQDTHTQSHTQPYSQVTHTQNLTINPTAR